MAKFLKHVGKHGDRKVAVIFRQVPGDDHMCLVVYTELLNKNIHDPMMTCIESTHGQDSENLGDALNRSYTTDGKIILQVLHREGMMKRVQTEQIVMTPLPNAKSHIRLNELNKLLNEFEQGEAAVKRLAEMDSSRGLQDPKDVARRMRENSTNRNSNAAPVDGFIDDSSMAESLRQQAAKMAMEAKGLLAESERLTKEADMMSGTQTQVEAPPKKARRSTKKAKAEG